MPPRVPHFDDAGHAPVPSGQVVERIVHAEDFRLGGWRGASGAPPPRDVHDHRAHRRQKLNAADNTTMGLLSNGLKT